MAAGAGPGDARRVDDEREVRLLRHEEYREAADLFRGAFHFPPIDDS